MKAFYCAGTHWDREWYEPFQEYRMWLVELIDELIDLMEKDPEYVCFHLDGQTVVLEDYLEIRPERRDRLVALLRAGRLIAGPWYDLPDEWLISGESYVRNLMRGACLCREMGVEPMQFAYTPDQFGHIAALPTIMNGFGLKSGICWRGTQDENYPAHFMWVGPDGSRMATFKLVDKGSYAPFLFLVRNALNEAKLSDESFASHFEPYLKEETARSDVPAVLMLDAIDHYGPDHGMPRIFAELRRRYPDVEFVWSSLAEFGREALKYADRMPERTGELREPCRDAQRGGQYLIVHTISSRYPVKRRNDQCQAAMELWAEPYALFHAMAGGTPIPSYLGKGWQYLLRNHPHDSICGCSVDQVHRDMGYRFDQCELIADGVVRRALAYIGKACDRREAWSNVVVHNPLPYGRHGVFDLALAFPGDWPKRFVDGLATAEPVNKFILTAKDGRRIPFQLVRIERGVEHKVLRDIGRNATHGGDIYHVAADLELPPCGHTAFRIEPTDEAVRNQGTLMTGPLSASNGLVRIAFRPDGTADLGLEDGRGDYARLFLYEDCGDSGDGWTRGQCIDDIVFRSPGTFVTTGIQENGPLRTVFRVERTFDLPPQMDRKTYTRSANRIPLRVTDLVYVEKGVPWICVRTHIDNPCMDHRFRVLFPTGVPADVSFAETPFAIVERPIDIAPETAAWQERVNPEKAFTRFFGVEREGRGLAVLVPFGLHEYEVTQTRDLALTLFRSTWKTVGTPGQPDGELLGTMDFEYILYPFADGFDAPSALRALMGVQAGVRSHTVETLPDDHSFLRLTRNAALVTAIKPAEDGNGGVIRFWNPTDRVVDDEVLLASPAKTAYRCDLNETTASALTIAANGSIPVYVPPRGITTIRFSW